MMAYPNMQQDLITLQDRNKFQDLSEFVFAHNESDLEYDVRIHCSDGQIVSANRHLLSLGFHLFRKIFGSDCSCVTHLPIVYDVICHEFASDLLPKVMEWFHTGQGMTYVLDESQMKEIQSILETFQVAFQFEVEPVLKIKLRQNLVDEQNTETTTGNQKVFSPPSSENHQMNISVASKDEVGETVVNTFYTFDHNDRMTFGNDEVETVQQNLGPFQCGDCAKYFAAKKSLNQHIQDVHQCKLGPEKFAQKSRPKEHEKCNICGKMFDLKSKLQNHMRGAHGSSEPYRCLICLETSETEINFYKHIEAAHGKKYVKLHQEHKFAQRHQQHLHKCLTCGKAFDTKTSCNDHIRATHENPCGACGKIFKLKASLKQHYQAAHKPKKLERCHFCHTKFASESEMKKHLQNCSMKLAGDV